VPEAEMIPPGLDLTPFTKSASLTANREGWDAIIRKVKAGEMPPKGIPKPAALDGAIQFLTAEFEKADRGVKIDPGRVTARRLNRAEYTNTIRDLLGVEFQAEKNFPFRPACPHTNLFLDLGALAVILPANEPIPPGQTTIHHCARLRNSGAHRLSLVRGCDSERLANCQQPAKTHSTWQRPIAAARTSNGLASRFDNYRWAFPFSLWP